MVTGRVTSHAIKMRVKHIPLQLEPAATMVPAIPEVTICVVLTGKPLKPEKLMRTADTVSADAPERASYAFSLDALQGS